MCERAELLDEHLTQRVELALHARAVMGHRGAQEVDRRDLVLHEKPRIRIYQAIVVRKVSLLAIPNVRLRVF